MTPSRGGRPVSRVQAGASSARTARGAVIALVVAGALTHFIGLTSPRQVVFDEVHWGKFVSAYCCTGQRVFDVHPPHGKLLLTLGGVLGGYDGAFSFDHIGQPYDNQPVFFLRLIPALVGIALAPLFFAFLRSLGSSLPTAFLGGSLLVCDNALLLETRVLVFDGLLVAAILGSLVCLLQADAVAAAHRRMLWWIASGALAGLAVGIKFTGLAVVALIAMYLAVAILRRRVRLAVGAQQALVMGVAAIAIYVAGWAIHFALTPNPGPADGFHATSGSFLHDLIVTHRTMWSANLNLGQTHPDASTPLTWPWMRVAPFFWAGSGAVMYLVGNPIVWWGSSLMLIVIAVNAGLMKVTHLRFERAAPAPRTILWLPTAGYVVAFLPLFGVRRVLFLYHYFTPLLFALAIVLLWLERAGWIRPDGLFGQRTSYYATIAVAIVAFLLVSPLTYGVSLGGYEEWLAAVVRSWR
jgi:dolichyl-phosphate-mannose--protein O-mannosyl transferase